MTGANQGDRLRSSRLGRRVGFRLGLAALVVATLSGCTVEFGTVLGLTKDETGRVQAVAAVCSGYIDSVAVTDAELERVLVGRDFDEKVQTAGAVYLTDGPETGELTDGDELSVLIGATSDTRWQATGPDVRSKTWTI